MTTFAEKSGLALHAPIGVWAVALVVAGGVNLDAAWAVAPAATGVAIGILLTIAIVRKAPRLALYGSLTLTSLGLAATGALLQDAVIIALGVTGLIIVAAVAPLAGVHASAPVAAASPGADNAILDRILEHTMLSDAAKRVLFREREVQLLRDAVEHEIQVGKYNVALTLCDEMAALFGHREEAEAFRARIIEAHHAQYEAATLQAIEQIDQLLASRRWLEAHRAMASVKRLYPDSPHLHDLDGRFQSARDEHKRELEAAFIAASEREDVEVAMDLLKELDRYLAAEEAARLREVAAGVIAKHRENLSTQFKLAVSDHRWAEAAEVGAVIMREFPNTKMADEVRSMIDVIRTRATQAAVSEEVG